RSVPLCLLTLASHHLEKRMSEAYTLPCGFEGPSGRASFKGRFFPPLPGPPPRGGRELARDRFPRVSPRSSRSEVTVSVAEMIARSEQHTSSPPPPAPP